MPDLPFDLGPGAFALLALGLLIASFARGYSGFGFSALLVATGSLVTHPMNVVALAIFMEVVASVLQAVSVWRNIDFKRAGILVAGALAGNPLGVILLSHASADMLRLGISGLVLVACTVLLSGWHLQRQLGVFALAGLGIVAGIANGATALGGLPIALLFVAGREKPAVVRATLIAYFFLSDAYAGTIMAQQGVLNAGTLYAALWAMPLLLLGLWLGGRSFKITTPETFRRGTLFLLIALALLGIAKAAGLV